VVFAHPFDAHPGVFALQLIWLFEPEMLSDSTAGAPYHREGLTNEEAAF
jgi:hypothetical protein